MKRCSKCKETKAESLFSMDRRRIDGLNVWCKACVAAKAAIKAKPARRAPPMIAAMAVPILPGQTFRGQRATDPEETE